MDRVLRRIKSVDPTKSVLLTVISLIFLAALIDTFTMKQGAALMPRFLSGAGLFLCAVGLIRFFALPAVEGNADSDMGEGTDVLPHQALRYGLWMVLFIALLWLVGLTIAIVLFTSAFLWVERRASVVELAAVNAIALLIALPLGRLLSIHWPAGVLFSLF